MKNQKDYINKRSFSRFFAVQIFFSYFSNEENQSILDIKNFFEKYYFSEEFANVNIDYKKKIDLDFLNNILVGVVSKLDAISFFLDNKIIGKYSYNDIDNLIKVIFILATYEFQYTDTDKKIIINEYVDISAEYFDKKTVSFINAILDNISKFNKD